MNKSKSLENPHIQTLVLTMVRRGSILQKLKHTTTFSIIMSAANTLGVDPNRQVGSKCVASQLCKTWPINRQLVRTTVSGKLGFGKTCLSLRESGRKLTSTLCPAQLQRRGSPQSWQWQRSWQLSCWMKRLRRTRHGWRTSRGRPTTYRCWLWLKQGPRSLCNSPGSKEGGCWRFLWSVVGQGYSSD